MCKPHLACHNALKLTYSNMEFQFFWGGGRHQDTPRLNERVGDGKGREGKPEEGRERGDSVQTVW